jgi:hypothetical protein
MPPPAKLVSIQGGQIVPLVETVKVKRPPHLPEELPENTERLAELERVFIENSRKNMEVYDYVG